MKILHYVHVLPDSVRLDGCPLTVESQGAGLLAELYRGWMKDYPKFFKMDLLSKLGVIATELLVAEDTDRFTPREDRAVLLLSRTGPLCDDRLYQQTIAPENYFPSPALFVYTLANIVTGEIAIRNKYAGDTTAFELPAFSAAQIVETVATAFEDRTTTSAVCGWAEAPDPDHFEALLLLSSGDESLEGIPFTEENILKIKQNLL